METATTRQTHCSVCGEYLTGSSHYHCPNCWETCSMMGHWDQKRDTYSCQKREDPRAAHPAPPADPRPTADSDEGRRMIEAARKFWFSIPNGTDSDKAFEMLLANLGVLRPAPAPVEPVKTAGERIMFEKLGYTERAITSMIDQALSAQAESHLRALEDLRERCAADVQSRTTCAPKYLAAHVRCVPLTPSPATEVPDLLAACKQLVRRARDTGLVGDQDNSDLALADAVVAAENAIAKTEGR